MKFLENSKLAQLTAQLTDAEVCERVINGRIEAFSMKRAGTDKRIAHALGEKYQQEIKDEEYEISNFQKIHMRNRSGSIGSGKDMKSSISSTENEGTARNSNGINERNTLMTFAVTPEFGSIDKSIAPKVRKGQPPSSPKSKRVRISAGKSLMEAKTCSFSNSQKPQSLREVGRRRSSSLSEMPTSPSLLQAKDSAIRSRSESFSYLTHKKSPLIKMPYSNSPLGNFHESCTQRLMTDLILTLNASFPDYDFSNIRPSHFSKVPSSYIAMNRTNEKLSELAASTPQGVTFLPNLWRSIDEVINLIESEVYSYVPPSRDDDDDPLSFLTQTLDGTDSSVPLWTFNFFFVNKSLKRIVLLTCVQTMRTTIIPEPGVNGGVTGISSGMILENSMSADDSMILINDDDSFVGILGEDSNTETEYVITHGETLSRKGSASHVVEEEEEEGGLDFDMDADGMNQAVGPHRTTVV